MLRGSMSTVVACLVIAAMLCASGCTMTRDRTAKAGKAAYTTRQAQDEMEKASAQVDITTVALNALVGQTQGDLELPYKSYSMEVNNMASRRHRLRASLDGMRRSQETYLLAWQKDLARYSSPEARRQSTERRAEVADGYNKVVSQIKAVDEAYAPLVAELQDVRRSLGNDLTAGGISAMREQVAKANADASALQQRMAAAAADLRQLQTAMSTAAAPATAQAPWEPRPEASSAAAGASGSVETGATSCETPLPAETSGASPVWQGEPSGPQSSDPAISYGE